MTAAGGFITDASLAGLARWLRLLGFDTVVYPEAAGRPMLRLAAREGRIVLTRRRDLLDRQYSGRVELVPAQDVGSQLHHVVAELALEISPQRMLGICLSCNRKLVAVGARRSPRSCAALRLRNLRGLQSVRRLRQNLLEGHACPQSRAVFGKSPH